MKLYPALLAVSAGLCAMNPIYVVVSRMQIRHDFAAQCAGANPSLTRSFCDNVTASIATQSDLEYAFSGSEFAGVAVASVIAAPIIAFLFWLPLKAIVTIWKRAATRGNPTRNATESVTSPNGNADSAAPG